MTNCEYIVYERTGRWAAALRHASGLVARQAADGCRFREVRSLRELIARLHEHPRAMALVEVRRTNLAEILTWLADASSLHPAACCVALLDSEAIEREVLRSVADALFAAGVVEITDSPRHMRHVLAVGRRFASSSVLMARGLDDRQSFVEWAWALLPWQPA